MALLCSLRGVRIDVTVRIMLLLACCGCRLGQHWLWRHSPVDAAAVQVLHVLLGSPSGVACSILCASWAAAVSWDASPAADRRYT